MAYNKVGFHAGVGGNRNGIGEYMSALDAAGIPFSIKSVADVGLAVEAAEYARASGVPHNIILRFDAPGGREDDVPDYHLPPPNAAQEYWEYVEVSLANAPELTPYKPYVWLELFNEARTKIDLNDPNWNNMHPADWLGEYAHHLGVLANQSGYKFVAFGMNAGEPEPEDWHRTGMVQYLTGCANNPDVLAVSLHEGKIGDMNAPVSSFYPHLIGRFQWLFDACNEIGIRIPTTFITEWAWKFDDMPEVAPAMGDVAYVAELVAAHPAVRGVFLWNLSGGYGNLANKLQRLIVPITNYSLTTNFPDPPPIDDPPPLPPAEDNFLANPSFEDDWWHMDGRPEFQVPNDWNVSITLGANELPGGHPDYVEPEIRVVPREQLPTEEQELFILDGNYTLKIFKGGAPTKFALISDPVQLEPGIYEITLPIYPDLVWYYDGDQKVFADDPDAGNIRIITEMSSPDYFPNTETIRKTSNDWETVNFGAWNYKKVVIVATELTDLSIRIDFRCAFGLENNGWFMDNFTVHKIADPLEPREYSRTVHLIPQDITDDEMTQVVEAAYPEKNTITFSADDAVIDHPNLTERHLIVWDVDRITDGAEELEEWIEEYYPPLPNIEYRTFND